MNKAHQSSQHHQLPFWRLDAKEINMFFYTQFMIILIIYIQSFL